MARSRGAFYPHEPKRRLPDRLTRDEVKRLLAQPSRRYPTGVRNRALLRLLYRTGLRCSEALSLTSRDIDLDRCEVRVWQGKGGRDRVVWFDSSTAEWLDRWKVLRPHSKWFFCTLKGDQMSSSYARTMVARYGAKAGIARRTHPHLLRHTFATEMLEDGFSIVEVQRMLGHASLSNTAIYLHVADEDLRLRLVGREDRPG